MLARFLHRLLLQRTLSRPGMESVRSVDIVSLLAAGFCFGIAFGVLIMMLRRQ